MAVLVFKTMVYNRLPFMPTTSANDAIIDGFFQEECWEMQKCFQIGLNPSTGDIDETQIGVEANYNTIQKSILADLVAMYIVMLTIASNAQGTASGATPPVPGAIKYLSKSKAGSVDVEWKQINVGETAGFIVAANDFMAAWKSSASRKARTFGCIIDICDTCAVNLQVGILMPFVTVSDCAGCH